MSFEILISPEAIVDIDNGFDFYNSKSAGLGFEFTNTIDSYLVKISQVPTAAAVRYDGVRVKPVSTFPYTIHFIIDEIKNNIIVLRVFNTWQAPLTSTK